MKRPLSIAFVTVSLLTLAPFVDSSSSLAGFVPPQFSGRDINTLVALEATENDLLGLVLGFRSPLPAQSLGAWSGVIDNNGWSLRFSGQINGTTLAITQTGALNLGGGIVTWSDVGLFGTDSFTGSGNMMLDPHWLQTLAEVVEHVAVTVVIAGTQTLVAGVPVAGVVVDSLVSPLALTVEFATPLYGDDAQDISQQNNPTHQLRSESIPVGPGPAIVQSGTLDSGTGVTTITSNVVPEPLSAAQLCTGSILLMCALRLRAATSSPPGRFASRKSRRDLR